MSKVFRVFLSSTFDDWKAEREHLRKKVFPRLREKCEEKGGRFLPVDLRWGISEEAGRKHATVDICLDEVRRCCDVSPRPNFLLFLGDRYGWRPLPPKLSKDQWEGLVKLDVIKDNFNKWYVKDENAGTGRKGEYEYYLKEQPKKKEELDAWHDDERKMRNLIDERYLKDEGKVSEGGKKEFWGDFFPDKHGAPWCSDSPWLVGSIVEQELLHVLKVHAEASKEEVPSIWELKNELGHIHVFTREIDFEGTPSLTEENFMRMKKSDEGRKATEKLNGYYSFNQGRDDSIASYVQSYLPHSYSDQYDPIAKSRLKALKENVSEWLGKDNVHELPKQVWTCCEWLKNERPKEHNEEFGNAVETSLGGTIEKELTQTDGALVCNIPNTAFFTGYTDELDDINKHVEGSLLVFGKAGSGKSTLLAKAVEEAKENQVEVLSFWIGRDASCGTGEGLLRSIIKQLNIVLTHEVDLSDIEHLNFKELVELLGELCLSNKDKPVKVFVDALDQLPAGDSAKNMSWVPSRVPFVISTLSEEIKNSFKKTHEQSIIVELGAMDSEVAGKLLDRWLGDKGRQLVPAQQAALLNTYNGTPLHLKILFERVQHLKSSDAVPGWLPEHKTSTEESIKSLYDYLALKEKHGLELVARALSYIAATPYGIPEEVLLEVLRSDEELVKSFEGSKYWAETDDKIPEIVWSRLYHDLEPFLARRTIHGEPLLDFYHAQFRRVVEGDKEQGIESWSKDELTKSREHLEKLADEWDKRRQKDNKLHVQSNSLRTHLFRYGTENAIALGNEEASLAAKRLCNFSYLMERLSLLQANEVSLLLKEYRRLKSCIPTLVQSSISFNDWLGFIQGNVHLLKEADDDLWSANRILLQLGAEYADNSLITMQAEDWLTVDGNCDWKWLRSNSRPQCVTKNWCLHVSKKHSNEVKGIEITNDGTFLSWEYAEPLLVWAGGLQEEPMRLESVTHVKGIKVFSDAPKKFLLWTDNDLLIFDLDKSDNSILSYTKEGLTIEGAEVSQNCSVVIFWGSGCHDIFKWDLLTQNPEKVTKIISNCESECVIKELSNGMFLIYYKSEIKDAIVFYLYDVSRNRLTTIEDSGYTSSSVFASEKLSDETLVLWDYRGHFFFFDAKLEKFELRKMPESNYSSVKMISQDVFIYSLNDKSTNIWDWRLDRSIKLQGEHAGWVDGFELVSNKRFISWSGKDHTLILWDLTEKTAVRRMQGHSSHLFGIRVIGNGTKVISWDDSGEIRLWDISGNDRDPECKVHTSNIVDLCFSKNDEWVFTSAHEKVFRGWNLESGKSLAFKGHSDWVYGIKLLNESEIISWGRDESVKIWSINKRKVTKQLKCSHWVEALEILDNGAIAAWDMAGKVYIWNPENGSKQEIELSHVFRGLGGLIDIDGRILLKDGIGIMWTCRTGNDDFLFVFSLELCKNEEIILQTMKKGDSDMYLENGVHISWSDGLLYPRITNMEGQLIDDMSSKIHRKGGGSSNYSVKGRFSTNDEARYAYWYGNKPNILRRMAGGSLAIIDGEREIKKLIPWQGNICSG